ncbi:hypothetical protein GCM10027271_03420 [Saccharopolyspora gloriosae]|uniref:DNA-binding CsgD family transcriptional regulator/archaellum biogenesis ATPase FlaH n=1 Tax=Saccharopolyspora gloriosae TaxID=455344 RepID=A0A840NRX4_9PSEU|nr:LuxR family transcriptional regulator [Saccharopolyspora gloriosae]MBB5071892.1 DNA-binding CsgD family transcriptional regulator/archaellum biogenesis ATPase FlaH [Saccharopolyspora gloriosae]
MARERVTVFGRDEQWAAIESAVQRPGGTLLMLRGKPGEGKTALLDGLTHGWQRQGLHVLTADAADHNGLGALDALLNGVRAHLERGRDPQLLDAVAAAAKRRRDLELSPQQALLPLVHELARTIGLIAARERTVVIIEDVDRCGPLLAAALLPLVQRIRAVGAAVITSARAQDFPTAVPAQLSNLAETVVTLSPLSESSIAALAARWSSAAGRATLDQTVVTALRTGLGPLYGNPGTLLSTVDDLHARGRLVLIDEHFCLTPVHEPIALPAEHELVHAVRSDGDGTERVASVIAAIDPVGVDDLPMLTAAAAVGLDESGQVLDRLVETGVLAVDERERLRFTVPALAVTLRRRAGAKRLRALQTALARRMLAQLERDVPVDRTKLADHIVQAGPGLDGQLAAGVLIEEADRAAAHAPARAARWYQAALRHLPAEDQRWPRLLRALLRLRMSLGQYRELTEDVSLVAPAVLAAPSCGDQDKRESTTLLVTVGMCWLSALLHDERAAEPDRSARLFESLGTGSRFDAEIRRFCSAMFGGRVGEAAALLNTMFGVPPEPGEQHPVDLGEVLVLLNALTGSDTEFQHAWSVWQRRCPEGTAVDPQELREAGAMTDYATALELILGDRYGKPSRGSVLCYQKVLRAYNAGEWDTALSLTRHCETDHPPGRGAPARHLSRAIAAEICSERGDHRRAAEWLDRIPRLMAGGHIVAWVRCGVRYRAGDVTTALDEGWQDYLRYRDQGAPAGLERLLGRLVAFALREGDEPRAKALLDELAELDERLGTATSRETLLLMRGVVTRDAELGEQAVRLARVRGAQPQIALGCLLVGTVSPDPQPWLHESYVLAKRFRSTRGRGLAQEVMRERGVTLPRARTRQAPFSTTEIRIIDLVSDGFTNRQIAMTVQVSEKTVESHLTRLFARTGCRSRVELAAASLEGRLLARTGS